ncbi:hypothetical protein HY523_01315 [Candidatus Berkelbacteria bacterium]|nr:hypothetical protein [Candidatus Berkelbacteria bacterium]
MPQASGLEVADIARLIAEHPDGEKLAHVLREQLATVLRLDNGSKLLGLLPDDGSVLEQVLWFNNEIHCLMRHDNRSLWKNYPSGDWQTQPMIRCLRVITDDNRRHLAWIEQIDDGRWLIQSPTYHSRGPMITSQDEITHLVFQLDYKTNMRLPIYAVKRGERIIVTRGAEELDLARLDTLSVRDNKLIVIGDAEGQATIWLDMYPATYSYQGTVLGIFTGSPPLIHRQVPQMDNCQRVSPLWQTNGQIEFSAQTTGTITAACNGYLGVVDDGRTYLEVYPRWHDTQPTLRTTVSRLETPGTVVGIYPPTERFSPLLLVVETEAGQQLVERKILDDTFIPRSLVADEIRFCGYYRGAVLFVEKRSEKDREYLVLGGETLLTAHQIFQVAATDGWEDEKSLAALFRSGRALKIFRKK